MAEQVHPYVARYVVHRYREIHADNGVWLVDHVPPVYLRRLHPRRSCRWPLALAQRPGCCPGLSPLIVHRAGAPYRTLL